MGSFPFCVLVSLVGLAVLLCNAPAQGRLLATLEKRVMLGLHNSLSRGNVNPKPCEPLRPLQWDDTLARVANQYARRCIVGHNPRRTTEYNRLSGKTYHSVGENFFVDPRLDEASVVIWSHGSWHREISQYDYATNRCKQHTCGHYTQMVWSATTSIGCATHICNRRGSTNWPLPSRDKLRMTFCNYGPGGNYQGQRPYMACPPTTPTRPPAGPATATGPATAAGPATGPATAAG
eukprot:scpid96060/ scgid24897/ Peptidase inhibitor 16; Cysteine-rich protease inhibitor